MERLRERRGKQRVDMRQERGERLICDRGKGVVHRRAAAVSRS